MTRPTPQDRPTGRRLRTCRPAARARLRPGATGGRRPRSSGAPPGRAAASCRPSPERAGTDRLAGSHTAPPRARRTGAAGRPGPARRRRDRSAPRGRIAVPGAVVGGPSAKPITRVCPAPTTRVETTCPLVRARRTAAARRAGEDVTRRDRGQAGDGADGQHGARPAHEGDRLGLGDRRLLPGLVQERLVRRCSQPRRHAQPAHRRGDLADSALEQEPDLARALPQDPAVLVIDRPPHCEEHADGHHHEHAEHGGRQPPAQSIAPRCIPIFRPIVCHVRPASFSSSAQEAPLPDRRPPGTACCPRSLNNRRPLCPQPGHSKHAVPAGCCPP